MATTPITTIQVVHESDTENAQSLVNALMPNTGDQQGIVNRIINFFASLLGGMRNAKFVMIVENATSGIFASGTATLTFANITADDTITIAGKVLTWKVAAGSESEITIGADLAAATTNLTAVINAHSVLSKFLSATGVTATGVVTITSKLPGLVGTLVSLATSDATLVTFSPTTALGNVTSTQTQSLVTVNRGVA